MSFMRASDGVAVVLVVRQAEVLLLGRVHDGVGGPGGGGHDAAEFLMGHRQAVAGEFVGAQRGDLVAQVSDVVRDLSTHSRISEGFSGTDSSPRLLGECHPFRLPIFVRYPLPRAPPQAPQTASILLLSVAALKGLTM